jgi:hypothetical protein
MRSSPVAASFAAVLFAALPAAAQVDVAICAAATTSSTDCRFLDVQAKLLATGQFATVDVINASSTTPSLVQLQAYDAVIVWSNTNFQNPTLLGDTLADYVDAGGGVVVAIFANSDSSPARALGGRWQTGSYEVIPDLGGTDYSGGPHTLGQVHVPGHAVMNGVTSFDGGTSSFRALTTSLTTGSTLIAQWSDGKTLVAEGASSQRIDLGFYPPSSDCSSTFWLSSTDGDVLMANALTYVAQGGCHAPAAYCTSSTTTHGCTPALGATGTPSAAASSGFTVTCTSVEGQRSGLVFYGINGEVALPWGAGSTSYLCVKPPTQRTPAQSSGGTTSACDGQLSIDLLAFFAANPGALGTPIAAGQQYRVQAWFRDPPAVKTTNLSDALRFTMCP